MRPSASPTLAAWCEENASLSTHHHQAGPAGRSPRPVAVPSGAIQPLPRWATTARGIWRKARPTVSSRRSSSPIRTRGRGRAGRVPEVGWRRGRGPGHDSRVHAPRDARQHHPGLENANASAMITSDVDILVERSMYWPGPARRGGHNAMGVLRPPRSGISRKGRSASSRPFPDRQSGQHAGRREGHVSAEQRRSASADADGAGPQPRHHRGELRTAGSRGILGGHRIDQRRPHHRGTGDVLNEFEGWP